MSAAMCLGVTFPLQSFPCVSQCRMSRLSSIILRSPILFCQIQDRAFSAGLTPQLASFLLYSLSPFNPNPDILENKDLLTELTKQYKVLAPRQCH